MYQQAAFGCHKHSVRVGGGQRHGEVHSVDSAIDGAGEEVSLKYVHGDGREARRELERGCHASRGDVPHLYMRRRG